jgi:hypothetical protein
MGFVEDIGTHTLLKGQCNWQDIYRQIQHRPQNTRTRILSTSLNGVVVHCNNQEVENRGPVVFMHSEGCRPFRS